MEDRKTESRYAAKKFTEKDRFIYALIYISIGAIGTLMPGGPKDVWHSVSSILNCIIVISGTILIFKANGGVSGTDFLGRYFSVGFVLTLRFLVILIPVFAVRLVFLNFQITNNAMRSSVFNTIVLFIWELALFWRFYSHVKELQDS